MQKFRLIVFSAATAYGITWRFSRSPERDRREREGRVGYKRWLVAVNLKPYLKAYPENHSVQRRRE